MKRYNNETDWHEVEEGFQTEGINQIRVRSDKPATLYWVRETGEETPVGYVDHEEILIAFPPAYVTRLFRVETEGRLFVSFKKLPSLGQKTSTEKFTTLDRPAPLSPEMQAIQRMMRGNQLERDKFYADMERREHSILAKAERNARKAAASEKEVLRKERTGGDTEPQNDPKDASAPDLPEPPVRAASGADTGSGGDRGHEKGKGKKPAPDSDRE